METEHAHINICNTYSFICTIYTLHYIYIILYILYVLHIYVEVEGKIDF